MGEIACGTIDSFLLWRLSGGQRHATDVTNAARTMLFDIRRFAWDVELLDGFGIPRALLPEVRDTGDDFGATTPDVFGAAIPIAAIAGDEQAAAIGQACFRSGMIKTTYGTGAFALLNIGPEPTLSRNKLLTTNRLIADYDRLPVMRRDCLCLGGQYFCRRRGRAVAA